ncbi:MAG: Mur ligase domain-containing protein [Verrucomicrobiota bacterium]
MQLRRLLNELHPVSVEGPVEREIMGISYDSRRISAGMCVAAIPGHHVDGHDYIQQRHRPRGDPP